MQQVNQLRLTNSMVKSYLTIFITFALLLVAQSKPTNKDVIEMDRKFECFKSTIEFLGINDNDNYDFGTGEAKSHSFWTNKIKNCVIYQSARTCEKYVLKAVNHYIKKNPYGTDYLCKVNECILETILIKKRG